MAVLTLMLLAAAPAAGAEGQAQLRAAAARQAEAPSAPAPVADERDARETKERLRAIFEQYPPSVAQVLRLDPSLLSRPDYLAPYPTLANFLSQHPEVAHNPVFFLGGIGGGQQYSDTRGVAHAVENIFVGVEVMIGVMFGIGTFAWLVRSAIDHRRWLRAMKIQTEAHTKIVDRLASNEDLLAYMQSTAGQRFLTSSPIAPPSMDQLAPPMGAPFNRILWSVQAGVVLTTAGAGLWLAKNGVIDEAAQAMQVMAILTMALGLGFVLSALASYGLSRQLGLVHSPADHA
jgi:heme/copper-type cytochrome/quinol oxidase subunit 3